jgi:hypothetical protein
LKADVPNVCATVVVVAGLVITAEPPWNLLKKGSKMLFARYSKFCQIVQAMEVGSVNFEGRIGKLVVVGIFYLGRNVTVGLTHHVQLQGIHELIELLTGVNRYRLGCLLTNDSTLSIPLQYHGLDNHLEELVLHV